MKNLKIVKPEDVIQDTVNTILQTIQPKLSELTENETKKKTSQDPYLRLDMEDKINLLSNTIIELYLDKGVNPNYPFIISFHIIFCAPSLDNWLRVHPWFEKMEKKGLISIIPPHPMLDSGPKIYIGNERKFRIDFSGEIIQEHVNLINLKKHTNALEYLAILKTYLPQILSLVHIPNVKPKDLINQIGDLKNQVGNKITVFYTFCRGSKQRYGILKKVNSFDSIVIDEIEFYTEFESPLYFGEHITVPDIEIPFFSRDILIKYIQSNEIPGYVYINSLISVYYKDNSEEFIRELRKISFGKK